MSNPRLKPSDYTQQINQNLKIDHITRKIELVTSNIDPSEPPSIKNNDIKTYFSQKEDSGTECHKTFKTRKNVKILTVEKYDECG